MCKVRKSETHIFGDFWSYSCDAGCTRFFRYSAHTHKVLSSHRCFISIILTNVIITMLLIDDHGNKSNKMHIQCVLFVKTRALNI